MGICKTCDQVRRFLNEKGVCILCERGPGGRSVEKKVRDQYATGKPVKSAAIEK